jgi:glycosyltransferase involved in cell wall biosynthesis
LHGGIPEAVERGTSGWLVAERDYAGLAHALLTLAKTESHYSKMSAAAATRVSALFDLTAQARTLEGYYREAIALAGKVDG